MKKILEEIPESGRVGIGGHIRPDGDCVGACMGLYLYLKKARPGLLVEVYLEQPADVFSCIAQIDQIKLTCDKQPPYDVFIAVDTAVERLGEAQGYFAEAKKTMNIDHHASNASGCAMVNYVDAQASSASELVFELTEPEWMDAEIAKALYLGIIHDTGIFCYSNTSPKTLRAAAELISYGFDFSKLIDRTFYEKTYVQNQILGRALLESIVFMDGRCIVSAIDKKTMDFYDASPCDLEGIVSQLRMTRGVECAIFMYQTKALEYKVSLRSNGKVDVSRIASFFGGGGHVRAAGCLLQGTYHDCINNLSLYIERQLCEEDED